MNIGHVNYQEEAELREPEPGDVERQLRVQPFPESTPLDFTEDDYSGFKVFTMRSRFCVSYYAYDGTTDSSNRPVLTARFALLDPEEFARLGHDAVAVKEYLRTTSLHGSEVDFEQFQDRINTVADRTTFENAAGQFDEVFVARAVSHMLTAGSTNLYYENPVLAERFIRVAFSLLPGEYLMERSFSSRCADPQSETEDLLLLSASRQLAGRGQNRSVLGRLRTSKSDRDIYLDLGKSPRGKYDYAVYEVLCELLAGIDWYDIPWSEKRAILHEFIASKYLGRKMEPTEISDTLKRMQETVERAESFNVSGGLLR